MTEKPTPDVVAELIRIRAEMAATRHEVTRLHAIHIHTQMRHGWLKHVVDGLETDPHVQYKVHLYGVVYWLINFPLIAAFFFLYPTAWLKWGVFITLIYSIYANFATDYGAMSAAMAAFGDHPLPEIPVEAHIPAKGTDNK